MKTHKKPVNKGHLTTKNSRGILFRQASVASGKPAVLSPTNSPTLPELPTKQVLEQRASIFRQSPTESERIFRNRLHEAGVRFRTQEVIGFYIVDFLLPDKLLIIELDGSSHNGRDLQDQRRDKWLMQFGFKILRLTNSQVAHYDLRQINTNFADDPNAKTRLKAALRNAARERTQFCQMQMMSPERAKKYQAKCSKKELRRQAKRAGIPLETLKKSSKLPPRELKHLYYQRKDGVRIYPD